VAAPEAGGRRKIRPALVVSSGPKGGSLTTPRGAS
jgi:hypothetical protein